MIYQGSKGNISLFYKGNLISNFPLTKKRGVDDYIYHGDYLLNECRGIPILELIKNFSRFCSAIYFRKIQDKPIYKSDHRLFLSCLMALLRLKVIDNDDDNGYLIMPSRRPKVSA